MSTVPSSRHSLFLAGMTFLGFLIFGYLSDQIMVRHAHWIIADELIMAFAAAFVVFLYDRERSRFLSEKLRVIRDMNSFVRNELQVLYACIDDPEKTRISTAKHSVERIDWALREMLPGGHSLADAPLDEFGEHSGEKIRRSA